MKTQNKLNGESIPQIKNGPQNKALFKCISCMHEMHELGGCIMDKSVILGLGR